MPAKRIAVDRNAVIQAIRRAVDKLGRQPTRKELPRVAGISYSALLAHFPSIRDALLAAGIEPMQRGRKIPDHDLVSDWKLVTQKLGHPPNMTEYIRHGKYSIATFASRFGKWSSIAGALQRSSVLPSPRPRPNCRGPQHARFLSSAETSFTFCTGTSFTVWVWSTGLKKGAMRSSFNPSPVLA